MAITDISISEELMTNAPSIKYRGNEGPKSPEEERMMMVDDVLDEAYEQYIYDLLEQRPDATPMSKDEFRRMVIGEGLLSGGNPLPPDPTEPVNPFKPKPIGPVLPDKREMAAFGGIMGVDGRRKYGIGSLLQKAKDKLIDDLIPNEIKDNPLLTAAIIAGGDQLLTGGAGRTAVLDKLVDFKDYVADSKVGKGITEFLGKETKEGKSTIGGDILSSIGKNIVPIVGGLTAGLFTKNTQSDTPGLPDDNTALQLADLKKAANLLDQKQGLTANLNFLPDVEARKFSPAEMAIQYAQALPENTQAAAMGGRIGFNLGGGADMGAPTLETKQLFMESDSGTRYVKNVMESLYQQNQNKYQSPDDPQLVQDAMMVVQSQLNSFANGGRISKAEGGIMDLGGLEKDYRNTGGFVEIGAKEKADDVPARLSVNEFVFTADAVRNAGGGDIDEGAKVMENVMKHLEGGGQLSRESQGMGGARDMFAVSERLSEVV